ncbi:Arginine kinase [Vespula squamosa]|uniref:Arginine kinase n=1 Tax=Vespula squamosa TaxID=30214 RepID=A0ABD1ZUC0_VESSQ
MNPTTLKNWLVRGELEKLENIVLEGRGARLLGEHSPDLRTRVFLKGLPNYLTKISQTHDTVTRGSLVETQRIVTEEPKKKLAIAKDPSGIPLIHKAIYHDQPEIVAWLVHNYPITTQQKDKEGRTALHYCAACRDPGTVWDILIEGGCDASVCDKRGNPAAYYLEHSSEVELVETEKMPYRKVSTTKENFDFKPSNIRIWIHNRDIRKLQQVLWEGHGGKLRRETSNNPRVKKFLEAVPFIMASRNCLQGTVKDVHSATVKNDLQGLKKKLEDPVSPIILCSKDANGLNVLHKAAGLGYLEIAREILERYPSIVTAQDNEGKTPLHYASALKDDGAMYNLLTEYGADESKLDNKQKAAAFYKNRPFDVDLSNLVVVPEAPRVSGMSYPKNWDWRILEVAETFVRPPKKSLSGNDVDSAFESIESSIKSSNEITEDVKIVEEQKNDSMMEGEGLSEPTFEEVKGNEETEEKSSDDDVITGAKDDTKDHTKNDEVDDAKDDEIDDAKDDEKDDEKDDKTTKEMKENDTKEEAQEIEESDKVEDTMNEPIATDPEERSDPSTGDSGVDDPTNEDDQVIVGDHEELPEAELNEGSMILDPEVENLLENGNMEQLAALVLNGEGRRLVGRQSNNPELQAFIDNVPAYMGKIHAIHMAAREGNLRDLQSALDRRKFAIARDGSSPRGATPLHVAVVFGNTAVIRYLAGRFPETAHAIDLDGRTPLHYATTLADNGHYYNLLLNLGANPLIKDNLGNKADHYKLNQDDLSHKKLLRDFGASEKLAEEMLTDKVPGGDKYSARRDASEPETLATLERCFRLLAGARRNSAARTPSNPGTLLGRCLKRPIFDRIKHRVTRMDHNLFDVIWPAFKKYGNPTATSKTNDSGHSVVSMDDTVDNEIIVVPDYESYEVFAELFDPIIRELHCLTASGDISDHPSTRFFDIYDSADGKGDYIDEAAVSALENYDLDPSTKYVQAGIIECCRNLEDYTLPLTLTVNQLEDVERVLTSEFMSPEISVIMAEGSSEDEAGNYLTLSELLDQPSPLRAQLAAAGLLLPITEFEIQDARRLHGRHWPYGRGVYVTAAGDLAAWVNVQDHLRVISRTTDNRPGLIGRAYVKLAKVMRLLDQRLQFKKDIKFGFLSSRLHAIGNTLKFTLIIKFPELSKERDHLKHLCVVRGLSVSNTPRKDTYKIANQQCLSISELHSLQDFSRAISNILLLEKELTLNNSIRIASMIADDNQLDIPIFRTEEGRYLASSLGDPLIKGLTEVANARPNDPVTYLATYLYNFASNNKSDDQLESNVLIIPERENESLDNPENENGDEDAGYPQSPDSDVPESTFSNPNRDEHGQSMIHFAAVRSYSKDGLYHLLQETQVNVGFRDEVYRTARDVAEQANIRENVEEIDRWVVYLAARGETEKLVELLLEGYDHILDAEDDKMNIVDIATQRNHEATVQFLQSIPNYVDQREDTHRAIRFANVAKVKELLNKNNGGGKLLAVGKNITGRCALHIAVLRENEEIVRLIANTYPETLRIGDNLERTALHYAMGVPSVEILSNILIKAGAKRIVKDLKSRQPSYYFMNKSDIERLQEEEEAMGK